MLLKPDISTTHLKASVYGKSGSGKTTLGVTAPKPVILLSELQGFQSVKQAARRLGKPVPPTFWINSIGKLQRALFALYSDDPLPTLVRELAEDGDDVEAAIKTLPYTRPETVVLDSVTELCALVGDDIDKTAPPKMGKDGLPVKAERYWFVLRERVERMIRKFRDLPYHVIFLSLLDDRTVGEGEEAARQVGPDLPMRKLPGALTAAVNVVGVIGVQQQPVKDGDARLVHTVYTTGPSWMLTKPYRPLRDKEVPDFSDWVRRIAEEEESYNEPLDRGLETESEEETV